jgi:hypothetical protein
MTFITCMTAAFLGSFAALALWGYLSRAKAKQPDPADGYPLSRFGRNASWDE